MSAYATTLSESSKEEILAECLRQHDRAISLEAARIAYASEFPPDKDGNPDVGSIHENIRRLKIASKTNSIPRIYIAGPFTAKTRWEEEQNVRQAEALGYTVAELGAYPVIPHTNTRPLFIDLQTPEWWYIATLESMFTCDAVLLTRDWRVSAGARNEKEQAEKRGIPVFESISKLYRWLGRLEEAMSAYATSLLESSKEAIVEECLRQKERADASYERSASEFAEELERSGYRLTFRASSTVPGSEVQEMRGEISAIEYLRIRGSEPARFLASRGTGIAESKAEEE